jgi:peptide methionine sulfoxide reductase MsrA
MSEAPTRPAKRATYRSAIFPANAEQARVAKAYIAQLHGHAICQHI